MTLAEFRACFPLLAHRIYVNSCSQGALARSVEQAIAAFIETWHATGSPWDHWVGEVDRLRRLFAQSINAEPGEIAIMPSASAALAAIATSLDFSGRRTGVVLGEFEFPTLAHAWLAQARRGARISWAAAEGDALPLTSYERAIDDTTLIVPATHVCFRNGYRLDIAGLTALAHSRGAMMMLDDYQRTGSGPIDVHALGVDFMVTGALKYLLGPSGVAFLYVRRDRIEHLEPLVTGWFGRVNPFDFRIDHLDWSPTATRFEAGTPPIPNVYGAIAGLELLREVGLDSVARQVRFLVDRFVDGARARGLPVVTPLDPERRGPLVVIRANNAPAVVEQLHTRGVIASARGNGVRVSFHAYNNEADVDAVLHALGECDV